MSTNRPNYTIIDGFRIPAFFSNENFRSAQSYIPLPSDVFVVAFPKCGTHWMTNIVSLIQRKGCPPPDFVPEGIFLELKGRQFVDSQPQPRIIYTHLPFRLIPFSRESKYIFVARNPKDCCVSFYNHTKSIPCYNFTDGNFDEYFEIFFHGRNDFGDYFDFLMDWYSRRFDPNVLFITYEDMKRDTKWAVLQVAKFLGDSYYNVLRDCEVRMKTILDLSSVTSMRKQIANQLEKIAQQKGLPSSTGIVNPSVPLDAYVRKGIVGDWRNYFSEVQSWKMEKRFFEKTAGTDMINLWADKDWLLFK